jgi:uncharacterized protein (UPF0335 family)
MEHSMSGSKQLRQFLFLIREQGWTVEQAAAEIGIGLDEAKLHAAAEDNGELASIEPLDPAAPPIGHNQPENTMSEGAVAADELRLLIERVERLEEEKKGLSDDIRDVYGEAKARGFDAPTMRRLIRLRKMEQQAREEAAALLETYASAVGLQGLLL